MRERGEEGTTRGEKSLDLELATAGGEGERKLAVCLGLMAESINNDELFKRCWMSLISPSMNFLLMGAVAC